MALSCIDWSVPSRLIAEGREARQVKKWREKEKRPEWGSGPMAHRCFYRFNAFSTFKISAMVPNASTSAPKRPSTIPASRLDDD
jgi:hypothetical protein